jgi:hypothetical protein
MDLQAAAAEDKEALEIIKVVHLVAVVEQEVAEQEDLVLDLLMVCQMLAVQVTLDHLLEVAEVAEAEDQEQQPKIQMVVLEALVHLVEFMYMKVDYHND